MGNFYIMYVDESGDKGKLDLSLPQSATKHYALAGIIVPADDWLPTLNRMIALRRKLKQEFGFPFTEELHGTSLFNPRGSYHNIPGLQHRSTRMQIYHYFMKHLPEVFVTGRVLAVYLDKTTTTLGADKWYEIAWRNLLERFQTYIRKQRPDALGILVPDEGDAASLRRLARRLRRFNPTASKFEGWYNNILDHIVEDPFHRESKHSFFIQAADMVVHALYRQENPKGSYRRFNAQNLFSYLKPILVPEAAPNDPRGMGIKRI